MIAVCENIGKSIAEDFLHGLTVLLLHLLSNKKDSIKTQLIYILWVWPSPYQMADRSCIISWCLNHWWRLLNLFVYNWICLDENRSVVILVSINAIRNFYFHRLYLFSLSFQMYHRSTSINTQGVWVCMALALVFQLASSSPAQRPLLTHHLAKRSFFNIQCKGVYDKSIFARLDRICEDCYNLFREPPLHSLCRWINTHEIFL